MNIVKVPGHALLEQEIKQLMIPAEKVAHVLDGNTLEHALLVLSRSGYMVVPVLDHHSRIQGLISQPVIFGAIVGTERIEFERLGSLYVHDVMNKKVPRIKESDAVFRGLELSINNPFICVEDEQGVFKGILTRRSILALVYRHFREEAKL